MVPPPAIAAVSLRSHFTFSYFARLAVLAVSYFCAASFGLQFQPIAGFASLVWPASGIAVAALILGRIRLWPAIFFGAFAANAVAGAPIPAALGIATGNTLEAVAGAAAFGRFGLRPSLDRVSDVLRYIGLVGAIGSAISASVGVSSLLAVGVLSTALAPSAWFTWWIGDLLGILVAGSFLLVWISRGLPRPVPRPKALEAASLALFTGTAGFLVFGGSLGTPWTPPYMVYAVFLPLMWAALRFGPAGATAASVGISIFAILGTAAGYGPFAGDDLRTALIPLQLFRIIAAATTLILAASASERNQIVAVLRRRTEDIERHRRAAEAERAKSYALLASIGEPLVATDHRERIIHANRAFDDLVGKDHATFRGQNLSDALRLEDEAGAPLHPSRCAAGLALSTARPVEIRNSFVIRHDGTKVSVEIRANPVLMNGRVIGSVNVLRDVTHEREADRAKTEFVSIASHQLRTPLSIVNWHLEAVLAEQGPKDRYTRRHRYIVASYRATRRLFGMVNALLNISHIEANTFPIQPRPINIIRFANDVLDEFMPEIAAKKLRIKKRVDPRLPPVNVDPSVARIVLQNIISNAVKYTPKNGSIGISCRASGERAELQISDSGYGIPKVLQPRVFEKFFRGANVAERIPEGSGLGLYIARALLERAGGSISFSSAPRKGTTFTIQLPLSRSSAGYRETLARAHA